MSNLVWHPHYDVWALIVSLIVFNSAQKKLISVKPLISLLQVTTKPVVAFFLFNFVMVGMHWTNVINLMVTNTSLSME